MIQRGSSEGRNARRHLTCTRVRYTNGGNRCSSVPEGKLEGSRVTRGHEEEQEGRAIEVRGVQAEARCALLCFLRN